METLNNTKKKVKEGKFSRDQAQGKKTEILSGKRRAAERGNKKIRGK